MKAGVRIWPRGVSITPVRAAPSVACEREVEFLGHAGTGLDCVCPSLIAVALSWPAVRGISGPATRHPRRPVARQGRPVQLPAALFYQSRCRSVVKGRPCPEIAGRSTTPDADLAPAFFVTDMLPVFHVAMTKRLPPRGGRVRVFHRGPFPFEVSPRPEPELVFDIDAVIRTGRNPRMRGIGAFWCRCCA